MRSPRYFCAVITACLMLIVHTSTWAEEQPISIVEDGVELHGSLLVPATDSPMPVALIIAGSGPTDRNGNNPVMVNNSLKMLAEGLAEHNIASLRYDKRGVAQSLSTGIAETDLRFEDYIQDAVAWIDLLKADERFSEVWVVGHSEGSLIGMVAANEAGADGLVSLAGVGESADLTLKRQLSGQPEPVRSQMMSMIDQLKAGELLGPVDPMFAALFRESVQPYLISWFRYDPAEWIAKLDVPVLIIQGSTDIQVTVDDANALYAASDETAELVIIEGMNHILKDAPMDRAQNIATYTQADLPLAEGLLAPISEAIQR